MKVKIQDIFQGIIIILVIMNLGILNIADTANLYRYITSVVSLIMGLFCICDSRVYSRIKECCYFINRWLIVLFLFLLIEVIYGWAVGKNSLVQNLSYVYLYFWLFLFYPVVYIMLSTNGKKRLIKAICVWTMIALVLKTFVWFAYNYLHKEFMHYLLYEFGGEWRRNGFQRIPATCFTGILFCTMIYLFWDTKKIWVKIVSAFVILFNIWYALAVFASRAQLICFAITISVVVLWRRNIPIRKMMTYLVFIVVVVIGTSSVYFEQFVSGMSLSTYSMGTRVREFSYYIGLLKKHWVMGYLYIFPETKLHGPAGQFYLSDLGLFSKIFEVGVAGFLLHLIPLWHIFQKCRKYVSKNSNEYVLGISLVVFTITFSFLSNDIYNFRLLFGFPFILSYYECLPYQYRKNKYG